MHPILFRSVRPVARSAIRAAKPANRAFSLSAARWSGPASPSLFGEGSKAGEVPTDINQSTGLDRLQTLGNLEGVEVFDLNPLDASRIGTVENPILVYSLVRCVVNKIAAVLYLQTTCRTLSAFSDAVVPPLTPMTSVGTMSPRTRLSVAVNVVLVSATSTNSRILSLQFYLFSSQTGLPRAC